MKPKSFMLIAGEASGDLLAAELVRALREELASAEAVPTPDHQPLQASLEPRFFGAGGPRMAAAGVELAFDLTEHSVIGLSDVLKKYFEFRRLFERLYELALEREPEAIICVDFSGFNRRFAHAIRQYVRSRLDWFHDWDPKIIQYVSPQVWASREGRAFQMARDYDLLLSTFAFEKDWYAKRVPELRVEFVGNPIMERYGKAQAQKRSADRDVRAGGGDTLADRNVRAPLGLAASSQSGSKPAARIVLLPGSRKGELRRHLPLLKEAAERIGAARPAEFTMVLPNESLAEYARSMGSFAEAVKLQVGRVEEALAAADLAITKSGTITLECAYFGVPAVVFYKTSPVTYWVGRQVVKVKHIAMPNLLANEEVFPEFIQGAATPEAVAGAALELLGDEERRRRVKSRLAEVVGALGGPGASRRAGQAIVGMVGFP